MITCGFATDVLAAMGVNLGVAEDFAVLAGSTVTSTGATTVNGNLGLSPGSSVTGFLPGILNGTLNIADATAQTAQDNMNTASVALAGQSSTLALSALGGTTKIAGVYSSADGTFSITGTLTLDAQGNPDAIFIFHSLSTLITASASNVVLLNGAQACNVYWQVDSSATLGTNSSFKGNVLAVASITVMTNAVVEGRVLAKIGAVTLDTNTISKPTCTTPPPPLPVVAVAVSGSGSFVPRPLIFVTKTAEPTILPLGPGSVTYSYTVTNVGLVTLYGVWAKDDKCTPLIYISGDVNKNNLLEVTEAWKYACTKLLSQTEKNIVTAHGAGNGWDGYATASTAVVVSPKTPIAATPEIPIYSAASTTPVFIPVYTPVYTPVVSPSFPHAGFAPQKQSFLNTLMHVYHVFVDIL